MDSFDKLRALHRATAYLHWDELRHRTAPEGSDVKTWWKQLKAIRRFSYVEVPLRDTAGAPFQFSLPNELHRKVHELDRIMSGQGAVPAEVKGAARDRYLLAGIREEAIRSSQLEGAVTTRRDAIEMLRTGRSPQTNDERMIANNYAAIQWIRDQARRALTPAMVIEVQRILTEGAIEIVDGSGRLRRHDETITVVDPSDNEVVHTPPHADELETRLAAMCEFANSLHTPGAFIHPILRAITLHFWLAYDHPFVDGNGRTARALFYWSMLNQGYWLTEFVAISTNIREAPAQYARAFLFTESDDNDLTYFFFHQIDVVERAIRSLFDYLEVEKAETASLARRLERASVNPRQLALLAHAVRKPATEYTIASHQQRHGIVYDTARVDLLDLARRGFLARRKRGREFVFVVGRKLLAFVDDASP